MASDSALAAWQPRTARWRRLVASARFLPLLVFFGVWQLVVTSGLVDRTFLPSVDAVALALWEMMRNGEIFLNLWTSVYRAFAGLLIGSALGVVIGVMMATSKRANGFFGPLVAMTYSLPKSSLVPLFILWFGIGDVTNILTVILACLLPVVVSTYHGVQAVPPVLVWSAQAMGTPHHLILRRVLLPPSLLSILTGVRIALGFCFVLTISAEMIAAKAGIGKLIFLYGENGAYAHMFGGILAIVVVAYAADRAFVAWMNFLLRWHEAIGTAGSHG